MIGQINKQVYDLQGIINTRNRDSINSVQSSLKSPPLWVIIIPNKGQGEYLNKGKKSKYQKRTERPNKGKKELTFTKQEKERPNKFQPRGKRNEQVPARGKKNQTSTSQEEKYQTSTSQKVKHQTSTSQEEKDKISTSQDEKDQTSTRQGKYTKQVQDKGRKTQTNTRK